MRELKQYMDVLSLLRSKNRCLQKFLEISEGFLARGALLGELAAFETGRDAALKAIELYDRKIAEAVTQIEPSARSSELADTVRTELDRRQTLVHKIVDVDLRIISRIEQEKARLHQEAANARIGKQKISRFKSTWVPESGEGLDEKL